ncbi:uncharacterized protein RAG0_09641 [Rhynchosporium agropyri]|uniref:Uncharacterized protein n=1 Tax=Rhynchosporium agropyri TaxID=914238 RepID=A0A1E1KWD1_9HELO|nr:uncharacterized protein RAG0_09641 [Rhynchosporium agropyri]
MKLTAFLAAAILAYPAMAAPAKQPGTNGTESTGTTLSHKYVWATSKTIGNRPGPTGVNPTYRKKPASVHGYQRLNFTRTITHKPRPAGFKSATGNKPVNFKAIPTTQDLTEVTREGEKPDEQLGPIPISVAPNGIISPASSFEPSSADEMEDISQKLEQDNASLESRAAVWKPAEINNYHEGVKIDIRNSIIELKDKLDYLNKAGLLTSEQANKQIDELTNVISRRNKLNFIKETSFIDEMLPALRMHIVSEIENGPKVDSNTNAPLTEAQKAEQDSMFANLHAHYILEGLQEKLVRLARNRKLDKRLGNINIMQTRQIIQTTPNLSKNDLRFYEGQLERTEKAMQAIVKKKLVDLPASAVSLVPLLQSPLNSDLKLPGEHDTLVEPSVEEFASQNQDLQNGISMIEGRSTPLVEILPFPDHIRETMHRVTVHNFHKRDANVTDNSSNFVNLTVTDTAPITINKTVPEDSYWIDFGAPECLKIIFDEDLDQAKLEKFESCEEKFEPEIEAIETEEAAVEARNIEKHVYEMDTDKAEWGRGVIH